MDGKTKIDISGYWMALRRMFERLLEIERGSTRLHSVENLLWKRLWMCLKADNVISISIRISISIGNLD